MFDIFIVYENAIDKFNKKGIFPRKETRND